MLGKTKQIFKKLFYAGIVAAALLAGAAGKAMSAPDSNSIIVDDIELYIETDKTYYYLGENVEMLYRLTNLGFLSATIPCMEIPPINILVIKDGQTIREKHPNRFHGPIDLRLWPRDPCEITFCWDMNDFDDVPVEPSTYDVLGVIADTIGLPDVGVQITILPEPRTITVGLGAGYDFNTIQAAIDDSNDGDTIIVADGTYTGDGNRDIDFLGKAITLRSENGPENCIIDCQGSECELHRGFYFHSGEDANSVMDGFTITNGYAYYGGGIRCRYSSSPTIRKCIIRGNVSPVAPGFPGPFAKDGGGVYCSLSSSPTIQYCHLVSNVATGNGGSIYSYDGRAHVQNCVIIGNYAGFGGGAIGLVEDNMSIHNCVIIGNRAGDILTVEGGGGIYCNKSTPTISNCTISGNLAAGYGGGIYVLTGDATVVNSILWENAASQGQEAALREGVFGPSSITISYSDVQGGAEGVYVDSGCTLNWEVGNIDADPNFADTSSSDPNEWDHHLKSQAGRWENTSQAWVQDEITSRCIDAGDPGSPIGDEPFPNGGIINMGAYGGTAEASKSYFGWPVCEIIVAGDINGDCKVNFLDFRLMAFHWLKEHNQ